MKKSKILLGLALVSLMVGCGKKDTTSKDEKSIKVGIIQTAEHIALNRAREGFIDGLKEKGFKVEENTVNAQGDMSLIPTAVSKFQNDKVDVIYAIGTPAAQGAKNMVKDIPIIFSAVTDPVSTELLENEKNPEGNITGVSDYFPISTQLKKFLEIFPDVKNLGVLYSTGETNSEVQIEELNTISKELGINLIKVGVATTNDVAQSISSLSEKIDAYVGIQDNLASTSSSLIANELKNKKIPSMAGESGPVENGLLLSEGIDYIAQGKLAANIVEEIKNGKAIKEIPVVYSKETTRVVNETTAQTLEIDKNSKLFENAKLIK